MDHRRIFNAKTGAIAGIVLTPVAVGLYAMANPEFKELPLERIVEVAALALPINIGIASAVAYGFGYLMNYNHKRIRSYLARLKQKKLSL